MSTTLVLDKSGRLVLPKPIRDLMRLTAGSKLRVDVVGDKIELSQEVAQAKLVKRGKRRVVAGWKGFDAAKAVQEARKQHLDRLEFPFLQ